MNKIGYQVRVEESVVRWVRVEAARRGVSQGEVLGRLVELHRHLLLNASGTDETDMNSQMGALVFVGLGPVEE